MNAAIASQYIEDRQFTYVSFHLMNPFEVESYVILEPSEPKARAKAKAFVRRMWPGRKVKVHLYPRTYVRKARELATEGRIIN